MQYDEKTWNLLHDSRLINLSESVLFPMLDSMIDSKVHLMVSKFNGGEHELLADVAGIASLYELKNKLKAAQSKGNKEASKLTESKT
jgi:hypothetical protein